MINTLITLCSLYGALDCDLVQAISWQETRHKNTTVMDRGSLSYGPMQIKCDTARLKTLEYSLKYDCDQLYDEKLSVRFGIYYINYQLERYEGNIKDAISAYNMGTAHTCKDYNPGHCYPGEHYNYKYVNSVYRRYSWLKRKKQEQVPEFLTLSKDTDTSEKSQTEYKSVSLISLDQQRYASLGLRSKPFPKYRRMVLFHRREVIPLIESK